MGALADDPSMDGAALGRVICDAYYEGCQEAGTSDDATLSLTDLSRLESLMNAYERFGAEALAAACEGESLITGTSRLAHKESDRAETLREEYAARFDKDTLQNGMMGVANLLRIVAPLYLMCSPRDVAISYQVKCPFTQKPTLILYDNCPGGVGLAEKAYRMRDILLTHARMIARDCPCEHGCPSCVGPVGEVGENGKATALALIDLLLQKEEG